MAALTQRLRAAPFQAARPAAVPRFGRVAPVVQRPRVVAKAAADLSLEDFADEDVNMGASAGTALPIASEDVRLRVRMRGYDVNLLSDAIDQVRAIADVTGAEFKGPVMLPTKRRVYCVLRSPHVNKDAREHFEIRTHHRLVDLKNLSAQSVEAMMQWIPPAGVEVEASIV
mmetsp:Transcript_37321/g.94119  ORF Transcript_37321/g.94119 Transcript_37321/m.94119 type:complete len:171 (-) Transcript_37321:280-792(-)